VASTANIHLITGEDDYLVEQAARKAVGEAVPAELRGSAVETIDGAAENAESQLQSLRACEASVATPPFLDPVKLTWWRNVTFLPGGGRGGSIAEDVKEALEKFAAGLAKNPLPPNQHLVITAPRLLATSIFAKTFKTFAAVIQFASESKSAKRLAGVQAVLPDLAAAEGLRFAPGADVAFLNKTGSDTRTIVSELAKLRCYLGTETDEVTREHVAAITSVGGDEPELWDVTDAVAARDPAKVLRALARFAGENGFGILISTVLEKFFREMLVYRDAMDRGWLSIHGWSRKLTPEAKELLDATGLGPGTAKNAWAISRKAQQAARFSARELRVARFRLLQVREKLVSSTADDSLVAAELLRIVKPSR